MTPAVLALRRAGVPFDLLEYDYEPDVPAIGLDVAGKLGLACESVYKTLIVKVDAAWLAVGVVPVARSLDLRALAAALGGRRAGMAEVAEAERSSGYVIGAISPLGQRKRLPTVIDASALGFDRIYVSGGRRGIELGLAPRDLVRLSGATTHPITRPAGAG